MRITNPAGFMFIWPESSNIVEVFHPRVNFPGEVFEAVEMGSLPRTDTNLKQLAHSAKEYARL